jgi:hypothetical protein
VELISAPAGSGQYSLKNKRPSPPNYDKWFEYARSKEYLLDCYDQIVRNSEPLYHLAVPDFSYSEVTVRLLLPFPSFHSVFQLIM